MSQYACPNCDQPLPEGKLTAQEVEAAIVVAMRGNRYGGVDAFWSSPMAHVLTIRGKEMTPTSAVRQDESMPIEEYDRQGETYEISVVFGLGDQFFMKSGYADSYADPSWNGTLREVKATPKTVMVWE